MKNGDGSEKLNEEKPSEPTCACAFLYAEAVTLSSKLLIMECVRCGRLWAYYKEDGRLVRFGSISRNPSEDEPPQVSSL
jgi:hypothetical protein